jgi:CRISPR/Cas system CMR-associated protein Cmr5 small subunit
MILSYSSFCAEKRKLLTKVGLSADVACTREKKGKFYKKQRYKKNVWWPKDFDFFA